MKKNEAMNVLNMSVFSQAILKQAYLKACSKYHPDRNPGGLEMMKAVNVAYSFLKTISDDDSEATEGTGIDFGETMNNAINAIIGLDGVIIEICGNWIWLSGDTRPHKDAIKAAGFWWASKKMQWYLRPADYKSSGRGTYSMDEVRYRHGSTLVKTKNRARIK
ncbi:MAG: J domain-containing protein [Methylovulum sp.]